MAAPLDRSTEPTWRTVGVEGGILAFDRATGTRALLTAPSTQGLRLRAPLAVQFGITNACNLTCGFCSRDVDAPSRWTEASAFELLADLARAGVLEVAFGGGEPWLFPGFARLLRRLRDATPLAIHFTTNGTALNRQGLAQARGAFDEARLSLYEDNHWRESVALLAGEAVRFGVNWLMTPATLPRLEPLLCELVTRGVTDVLLLSYNGPDPSLHLDPAACADLARRVTQLAKALAGRCRLKLDICFGERMAAVPRLLAPADCGAGRDFVVITSDKKLAPCSFHHLGLPIESAADVLRVWRTGRDRALAAAARAPGCARTPGYGLGHWPQGAVETRRKVEGNEPTVRLWQAYASNNSGSYVLVGRFESARIASKVAEELRLLIDAEVAWRADEDAGPPSPLDRFIAEQHLFQPKVPSHPGDDAWPEHGAMDRPAVAQAGEQLLVYVDQTVTLHRLFGEWIYRRGGRVEVELDHCHERLVALFEVGHRGDRKEFGARWSQRLSAPDNLLAKHAAPGAPPPRFVVATDWSVPALRVAIVLADLAAGVTAIHDLLASEGDYVDVRILEATDPLAFLREELDAWDPEGTDS